MAEKTGSHTWTPAPGGNDLVWEDLALHRIDPVQPGRIWQPTGELTFKPVTRLRAMADWRRLRGGVREAEELELIADALQTLAMAMVR